MLVVVAEMSTGFAAAGMYEVLGTSSVVVWLWVDCGRRVGADLDIGGFGGILRAAGTGVFAAAGISAENWEDMENKYET